MKSLFFFVYLGLSALLVYQGIILFSPKQVPVTPLVSRAESPIEETDRESGPENKKPGPGKPGKDLVKAILARNLFKVMTDPPPQGRPPSPAPGPTLEKTQLKLALEGTVTGQGTSGNWAVIQDKLKRKQALYQEGDQIQGATIKQILRNKVILTVNGKDQILVPEVKQSNRPGSSGQPVSLAAPLADDLLPNGPIRLGTGPIEDRTPLLKGMKTRPYLKNGKPAGILVYGIRPKSNISGMGLRNGDIVREINGETISGDSDLNKIASALEPGSDINFILIRRGRTKQVVYHVDTDAFTIQDTPEE